MNAGASTDFMGKNSTLNRMFGAKQDNLTNYLLSLRLALGGDFFLFFFLWVIICK
jgi:hypothetical protein